MGFSKHQDGRTYVPPALKINETLTSVTDTFEINRERAIDYLNTRDNVYVFDGYAGVRLPLDPSSVLNSLMGRCSGTPSTGLKSVSFAHEHIMPSSWY